MGMDTQVLPRTEAHFIESLRARYEDEGFTFTAYPDATQLPPFLGSYAPDALARKPGQNVAIEVKQRCSPSTEPALRDVRRLFDGHSDWRFQVIFMGTDPLQWLVIPASKPATVRSRAGEVRSLLAQGHRLPAFVLAWSLLEAALRALEQPEDDRPYLPETVVQTLGMHGYIEPDTESGLRALIDLRNRVVHGDLGANPTTEDVELVLSAIDQTLSAAAHSEALWPSYCADALGLRYPPARWRLTLAASVGRPSAS